MDELRVVSERRAVRVANFDEIPDRTPVGRDGRRHRPRHHPPGRRALGALRPLHAPGRAAGRRHGRRRQPALRPARLGLPHRHRRQRLQQRRGAGEVHELARRRRRCSSTPTRSSPIAMRHPQPFDPDVYQGYYRDPAHGARGAVRRLHPRAGGATGSTKTGHHGPVVGDGRVARASCRRGTTSSSSPRSWPACRCSTTSAVGTEVCIGPERRQAAVARHPDLRVRHELRGALAGGQDGAGPRRRAGRHRHLLGRGRHAARGAGRERAATSTSWRRPGSAGRATCSTKVQAFHFKGGQGAKTGTGGHLPGPKVVGRIAEVRGLPEGTPGGVAGPVPRLGLARRLPRVRRRGARAIRRHPDRRQDVGPAHRGRPRRRAGGRRRLRHPRRPRRRHRRRAADLPRPHLGADDPGAGPGPGATSTGSGAATSPWSPPAGSAHAPDFAKALALGADAVAVVQLGHPGHRLSRHAGLPHRQLPGRHRHPEAAPAGPPARRRGRPAPRPLPAGVGRAHGGAGPGVRSPPPAALHASTTSPPSIATWPT